MNQEIPDEAVINSMRACGMSEIAIKRVQESFEFERNIREDFHEWLEKKK